MAAPATQNHSNGTSPAQPSTHPATQAPAFKNEAEYLFTYLLAANVCMYLEAGAVPALLLKLATAFGMASGTQGLLGGIVYLSLSLGGPFAGFLLKKYEPATVVGTAVCINNFFTLCWALTPTGRSFSTHLFIALRFCMGFTQCVVCVFLPLWTNEFAPAAKRTSWMSFLQASVPIGVMTGYIIASVTQWLASGDNLFLQAWRWPFLIQICFCLPFGIFMLFVPKEHVNFRSRKRSRRYSRVKSSDKSDPTTHTLASLTKRLTDDPTIRQDEEESVCSTVDNLPESVEGAESCGYNADDEEQLSRRMLRRHSLQASLYSAFSVDVAKESCDDLPSLETEQVERPLGFSNGVGVTEHSLTGHNDAVSVIENHVVQRRKKDRRSGISKLFGNLTSHGSWKRNAEGGEAQADYDPLLQSKNQKPHYESLREVSAGKVHNPKAEGNDGYRPIETNESASDQAQGRKILPVQASLGNNDSTEEEDDRDEDKKRILVFSLFRFPVYMSMVCTMASLYFVITGVQFWGTSYFMVTLRQSQYVSNLLFVMIAATGPTSGVFVGGYVVDKFGGYKGTSQRIVAQKICMCFGILAILCATPITFISNFYATAILLWIVLFCGAAVLPACSGMSVSSVPRNLRPVSSACSLMVCNLMGYFLSLVLSGYLMGVFGTWEGCDDGCARRFGFRVVLLWCNWALFFCVCAYFFSLRALRDKSASNNRMSPTSANTVQYPGPETAFLVDVANQYSTNV